MYTFDDVKRPNVGSPGAALAKDPNVTIIRTEDIVSMPFRNSKGVLMEGNFVLKPGAKPIKVYMTASKMTPSFENEGDEDAISLLHKYEGMHPGDELEINEFVANMLGVNVIVIYGTCRDNVKKVIGTPCAPLQLRPSFAADNESTNHTLNFEAFQKTRLVPGHFKGDLPEAPVNELADENITLSVANGNLYKLPSADVTAEAVFTNTDLETGNFVTVIGSGGADPYTVANPASGDVVVVLKDDTTWLALDDAQITFEVLVADLTYLIERSRS